MKQRFFDHFSSVHPDSKPAIVGHHQGHFSEEGFKLTSATTPISASFGHQANMVDGMMSSAFAAAAAAHQDSLSRMTSMTNSIAPPQSHTSHTAGQILGNFTCSATKTINLDNSSNFTIEIQFLVKERNNIDSKKSVVNEKAFCHRKTGVAVHQSNPSDKYLQI